MEPILFERPSGFSSKFSQTLEISRLQRDCGRFKGALGFIFNEARCSSRLKGILKGARHEMTDRNNSIKASPQNIHNVSTILNTFSSDTVLISNFSIKDPSQS